MNDANLTDRELLLAVDNDPKATPRELELAHRLRGALGWYVAPQNNQSDLYDHSRF